MFQENCSHASTFFPLIKKQKSRITSPGVPAVGFGTNTLQHGRRVPYAKPTILQVNLQYLGNLSYSVCVCLTLFVPPFTVSDSPPPRSAEPSITYDSHTRTPPQTAWTEQTAPVLSGCVPAATNTYSSLRPSSSHVFHHLASSSLLPQSRLL